MSARPAARRMRGTSTVNEWGAPEAPEEPGWQEIRRGLRPWVRESKPEPKERTRWFAFLVGAGSCLACMITGVDVADGTWPGWVAAVVVLICGAALWIAEQGDFE